MCVSNSHWQLWKYNVSFPFLFNPGHQIVLRLSPHFPGLLALLWAFDERATTLPLCSVCLQLPDVGLGEGGVIVSHYGTQKWVHCLFCLLLVPSQWIDPHSGFSGFALLVNWVFFPWPWTLGKREGLWGTLGRRNTYFSGIDKTVCRENK